MNEKLPYEEQLDQAWDTLPLPDEDTAWKDMKRRLDDDDDDKIIVPPPKKGCGIGALLIGLLLVSGLWFLVRPEKWFTKKETETVQEKKDGGKKIEAEVQVEKNLNEVEDKVKVKNDETVDKRTESDSSKIESTTDNRDEQDRTKIETKTPDVNNNTKRSEPLTIKADAAIQTNDPKTKKSQVKAQQIKTNKPNDVSKIQSKKPEDNNESNESVSNQKKKDAVDNVLNNDLPVPPKDSVISETKLPVQTATPPVTDSSKNKIVQPIVTPKKDSVIVSTKPSKQKDQEKRPIFFSAGLGLHQQIPISGQEWTTYGSLGRKGILSDYIPSVNFRMEKKERWFLQTEFRYGAPQHTRSFIYDQIITTDTQTQIVITNSTILKKSYYHQVPLTFNYYLLPDWSVGAGLQWNRFHSAVAEETITKRTSNVDSIISKKIVSVKQDSAGAFAKSWTQGIIQTQYQWKRFSIGARYAFGLQPYIRFTLPNLPVQQEKNSSFQIFLRYELWRSNK